MVLLASSKIQTIQSTNMGHRGGGGGPGKQLSFKRGGLHVSGVEGNYRDPLEAQVAERPCASVPGLGEPRVADLGRTPNCKKLRGSQML